MSFSGFQKKKTQFEYKINVIIKEQNNLKKIYNKLLNLLSNKQMELLNIHVTKMK